MQAALLPAAQVVWWFWPAFSPLPSSLPCLLSIYLNRLDFPPGSAEGMLQRLRLLDMIVNPFTASQAKPCCCHIWEGGSDLASLPQLPVLLKNSHVLRWSTMAAT